MDPQEPDLAAELAELGNSGLFDAAWYLAAYGDVAQAGLDPAVHFVRYGWREGRLPNPYFDPAWYRATYADVAATAINPLLHYLRQGDLEGRRPIGHFDPGWYRAAHGLAPDRLALRHFLPRRTGRFAPSAELYSVPFLPPWRDDPARSTDPFRAYLDAMARAGEDPMPDVALLAASGLVDSGYYLANGRDVQQAALDPTLHFCRFGWHEKRRPNIYFDTAWYMATNPRVDRLGLNPLVHYVCEGEAADRRPVPYFDPGWYRATYDIPPEQGALAHYLAHRHSQAFSPTPLFDVAWYVASHGDTLRPRRDPFLYYLHTAMRAEADPSPQFDAAAYCLRHPATASAGPRNRPRAEADIPLVHHLLAEYR